MTEKKFAKSKRHRIDENAPLRMSDPVVRLGCCLSHQSTWYLERRRSLLLSLSALLVHMQYEWIIHTWSNSSTVSREDQQPFTVCKFLLAVDLQPSELSNL